MSVKKTIFDILYALDQDTLKTHRSHTKKIHHICERLQLYEEHDSPILFIVQPPENTDENLKCIFHSRCHFVLSSTDGDQLTLNVVVRCKEKKTSRTLVTCRTMTEVQAYLDKGYKIKDCTVENRRETIETRQFSAHILNIFGKYVWTYFQGELEKLKIKVRCAKIDPILADPPILTDPPYGGVTKYKGAKIMLEEAHKFVGYSSKSDDDADPPYETDLKTMDFTDLHGLAKECGMKTPTYEEREREADYAKEHAPVPTVKLDDYVKKMDGDVLVRKRTKRAEVRKTIKECVIKGMPSYEGMESDPEEKAHDDI